ncbi:alpha-tubulin N-acetyltransferase 1 isoform X7 [Denticeps clupeoides]|uniref:alpha-tubulin N-acetyltransferase 1 isoform X7 n=1 Tax=Denticeps clupeoides TaxID=299321 RepID=UPI0010A31302|nr:alpha-tubulin N-acetyltransferase 1 isoform X7 [Denticeps clupeoides]
MSFFWGASATRGGTGRVLLVGYVSCSGYSPAAVFSTKECPPLSCVLVCTRELGRVLHPHLPDRHELVVFTQTGCAAFDKTVVQGKGGAGASLGNHCSSTLSQARVLVLWRIRGRTAFSAQLRKVPPKKAEGEIKPYSLMEREVVREERKVLPWPFVQPAAPPLSPRLTPSSQFSRSLSVGSSPSRAATAAAPRVQPGQPPHSQLTENCRARRTSHRGLVARGNLYSRHIDSRGVGRLLLEERKGSHKTTVLSCAPSGWQPELRESRCDTGRRADSAGHQHTPSFHRFPLAPFSHRGLPPPYRPPPVPRLLLSQRDPKLDPEGAAEGGVGRRAWSWTVGEDRSTAQWVRQKQESRSVWPW